MAQFLPDPSGMIAVPCAWHEHHERAVREIERRLSGGELLVVAALALVETYAVLTRLPPPHRLSPADSRALVEASFIGDAVETVALGAEAYRDPLRSAPDQRITGGRIYDAVIVARGRAARVDTLLTFNERQFRPLADHDITIVVPS